MFFKQKYKPPLYVNTHTSHKKKFWWLKHSTILFLKYILRYLAKVYHLIYLSHKIITSLKVITEKYLVIPNQKCLNFYVQFTIVSKMWYSCTLQVKSNHHFMIECLNGYWWVAHNRPKTSNKKCYFVLQIICQNK